MEQLLWLCALLSPLHNCYCIRPDCNHFAPGVVKPPCALVLGAFLALSDTATGSVNHTVSNGSGYYVFLGYYIIVLEEL
jgi:hypothetical protein